MFFVIWDDNYFGNDQQRFSYLYRDETLNQLISNLARHSGYLITQTAIYRWADPGSGLE